MITRGAFARRYFRGAPFCFIVMALTLCSAQSTVGNASEDSFNVVLARLKSTNIQYYGLGKASGAEFRGTARIKVLEILKNQSLRLQKHAGVGGEPETLVLQVEGRGKKPTWEAQKGQRFIFVLEPIPGTTHFRVLDVAGPAEEKLQRIRACEKLSREVLTKILHPASPKR